MSGNDWMFVVGVLCFVALVILFDRWRDLDRREAERAEERERRRFLMEEVRRQP